MFTLAMLVVGWLIERKGDKGGVPEKLYCTAALRILQMRGLMSTDGGSKNNKRWLEFKRTICGSWVESGKPPQKNRTERGKRLKKEVGVLFVTVGRTLRERVFTRLQRKRFAELRILRDKNSIYLFSGAD